MNSARHRFIWFSVACYAVLALLWVFLSDQLLSVFTDIESIVWLSTAKGVFFVITTAAAFYLALRAVPSADNQHATQRLLDTLSGGVAPGQLPAWLSYLFAIIVTLAMLVLSEKLSAAVMNHSLLILFMLPIIFSAMLGGLGPGLVATMLAGLGIAYFSLPPARSFSISAGHDVLQWSFLLVNGVAVSMLSEVLRGSLAKTETNRHLLDAIISNTDDAVFVKDAKGRYLLINTAAAGFVGKSPQDILGRDDHALFPLDSAQYLMALDQAILASGHTQTHEEQLLTHDGKTMVFLATKGPVLDKSGRVVGLFGISRDITERKRIEDEVRTLNIQLEQRVAARTAELNTANLELEDLTYALAHNLRAPVRAIGSFSQLLAEEHAKELDSKARNCLEQITLANRNMSALVDGILVFLRCTRGELQQESIDISALAIRQLGALASKDAQRQIHCDVQPGLAVTGDAAMLEMALQQLLENAWKFTRDQPNASIRVFFGQLAGVSGICIADNGAGFDMAHAEQLYKPFYRLHRQDEFPGIGIGLATVRRIIRRHGGEIHAEATPDAGATFCFSLPQMMEENACE